MYAKSAATIESILEQAALLFINNNYADVTTQDIANAAGLSKGALYHHFKSKECLYLALMLRTLSTVELTAKRSQEEASEDTIRGRLKQSLLYFLQLPEQTLKLVGLVRRDINIFSNPTRKQLIDAYQQAVPEQVEKLIKQGVETAEIIAFDTRLLSWMHIAMVEVALQPYSQSLIESHEDRADFLMHLFFNGVANSNPKVSLETAKAAQHA